MAGLLGDVLPWVYSRGNALQRHIGGLLTDPIGSLEQTSGRLQDSLREQNRLMDVAFGDQKRPFQPTNYNALTALVDRTMSGPMGFAPAGIMAGVGAKTANKAALEQALKLDQKGITPAAIWRETGWGKGSDGMWRFEIDDSAAKFEPSFVNAPAQSMNGAVGDVLDHPALFKAYPDLPNAGFGFYPHASNPMYQPAADKVILPGGRGEQGLSNMLHELQHAVQKREGFASGGNFGGDWSKFDAYMALPGEVEARLVQDRMKMTPPQRRNIYPY